MDQIGNKTDDVATMACVPPPPTGSGTHDLWRLMHAEHGLLLLEPEIEDIIAEAEKIVNRRREQERHRRWMDAPGLSHFFPNVERRHPTSDEQ